MTTIGPFLVGAVLLVLAGAAKVARPDDTSRALRAAGLSVGPGAVRAGAAAEAIIGIAAATIGGTIPALLVAASYTTFAVFVAVALGRGWVLATCGCFGEPDTPPTWLHVVIVSALAITAAATSRMGSPVAAIVHRPGWGAALVALVAVTTGLAYVALTRLPKLVGR